MGTTILLNGRGTDLNLDLTKPLQGDYTIALQSLSTSYSWPNITDENNKLVYKKGNVEKTITIPRGAYDVRDLAKFIQQELKRLGDERAFMLGASSNTMKATFNVLSDGYEIDMSKSSIKSLLGWNGGKLTKGVHHSDNMVDITNVNEVLIHCDLIFGIYTPYEGKLSEQTVIASFYPNVAPGYKINITRKKLFYVPMRTRNIQRIRVWLTDQDNNPIDNANERLTMKLRLNPIINT